MPTVGVRGLKSLWKAEDGRHIAWGYKGVGGGGGLERAIPLHTETEVWKILKIESGIFGCIFKTQKRQNQTSVTM